MRFAGMTAPGSGSGPFTGQRLAASALSTTKPLRPPVHVFRPGLTVESALRAVDAFAFFATPDVFAAVPNDSARTPGFEGVVAGRLCAASGIATIADARKA